MTRADADRLLALARAARWTFPSSFGRPVRGDEPWLPPLVEAQEALREAARELTDAEAIELGANAWRLWVLSRDLAGGRAFLGPILGRAAAPSREHALALYGDGLLAARQGAREDAQARNERALEAARAADDPEALALAHLGLSRVAFDDGEYERARAHAERARAHARGLDEAYGQAPLHMRAQATRMLGDYDAAAALFEESLALNRRIGDAGMVDVELHNLGQVEIHRGNVDAAERRFAELGSDDGPYARLNEAALAFGRGDLERARELLEAAEPLREEGAREDVFELDWLREQLYG